MTIRARLPRSTTARFHWLSLVALLVGCVLTLDGATPGRTALGASAPSAASRTYSYDMVSNSAALRGESHQASAARALLLTARPFVADGALSTSGVRLVAADSGLSAADQSALDYATTSSKLDHVLAANHNFDPLVQQYGSREAVGQQFLNGLKGLTPESGTFEQQIVVGGQKVVVRGAVVDGVTKIGTAFTP